MPHSGPAGSGIAVPPRKRKFKVYTASVMLIAPLSSPSEKNPPAANVMVDGRGKLRVTDFGLAALADEVPEGDVRSETPAYMAPESLEACYRGAPWYKYFECILSICRLGAPQDHVATSFICPRCAGRRASQTS